MTKEERLKEWLDIQIKAVRASRLCIDDETIAWNLSLEVECIHVSESTINTMRDLLDLPVYCNPRDDDEYPFEIFTYYDNIKFFRISETPYEEGE